MPKGLKGKLSGEKNFVTVEYSNKDIMEYLQKTNEKIDSLHDKLFGNENQTGKLNEITARQDKTNGRVSKALWIATTAITLFVVLLGIVFAHIGGN